ncbi:putative filamin/ABP280 repeat-containing domain protein [Trichinella spiralis]|nr:putative filamin/ABP280 repeat-containing domain protein [Trichinella spiralis]
MSVIGQGVRWGGMGYSIIYAIYFQ